MFQAKADVISKKEISPGVFSITLISPEISRNAKPGQFVHVLCGVQNGKFLLRRPFSIHRVVPGRAFEILFQVVGSGTKELSKVKIHDTLDVIGPLGTSFTYSPEIKSALLLAGGLGVAPLLFLAEELTENHVMFYAMLGAQTKIKLLRYIDFKRLAKKTFAATEDGSFGHEGTVVALLNRTVHQLRPQVIYAVGPEKMLQKVSETADDFGIDCQVSIEAKMACGIGACLGCTCLTRQGFKLTCKDGPIFNARDIMWGESEFEQLSLDGYKYEATEITDSD